MAGRRWLAAGILAGLWAALALPVLLSGGRLGIWDWDHHFAFAEAERQAIAGYGELPLWNPYVAGGTPLLQHPLSGALAPDFALVLLLGVPYGLKVQLALRLGLGLWGGWLLGRRLGMSEAGAALASAVAGGSGAYAAHVAFGHFEWTLAGYLPWAVLALWRAAEERSPRWVAAAAAGTALVYLGGGIYLVVGLILLAVVLAGVRAAAERDLRLAAWGLAPLALAGLLAAVKLVPSFELLGQHPRRAPPMVPLRHAEPPRGWLEVPLALGSVFLAPAFGYDVDPEILDHHRFWPALREGRVSREQAATRNRIVEEVNFHAYVGAIPLLLLPLALTLPWRRWLPWLAGLALLLLLVLSDAFARAWGLSPWQALGRLPLLDNLRTPGRLLIVAALPLGVLAGLGLTRLGAWRPRWGPRLGPLLAPLLALGAAAGLALDAAPLLARAFPYPARDLPRQEFVTLLQPLGGSDFLTVRAGAGALLGHTNLRLPSGVVPAGTPTYLGEAFLAEGSGLARLLQIRPNRIEVQVGTPSEGLLVVNHTYATGWRRTDRPAPVLDHQGRLATPLTPADRRVVLAYRPATLPWGIAVSLLALASAGYFVLRGR